MAQAVGHVVRFPPPDLVPHGGWVAAVGEPEVEDHGAEEGDRLAVFDEPEALEVFQAGPTEPLEHSRVDRRGVDQHPAVPPAAQGLAAGAAGLADLLRDHLGPAFDLEIADRRAGKREHHGDRVAEVLVELRLEGTPLATGRSVIAASLLSRSCQTASALRVSS